MKSFKYTINGNVYKVHINSVVDDVADVEVNGTPYHVQLEKPAKKQEPEAETVRRKGGVAGPPGHPAAWVSGASRKGGEATRVPVQFGACGSKKL